MTTQTWGDRGAHAPRHDGEAGDGLGAERLDRAGGAVERGTRGRPGQRVFGGCGDARGAAERASGRPGREWIIAHGGQSEISGAMGPARARPPRRGASRARAETTAWVDPRRRSSSGSCPRRPRRSRRDRAVDAGADPTPAFLGEGALLLPLANGAIPASGAGNSPAGRGGAGDDGGDSSRGDGKGSHYYWCSVRSKMRVERR